MSDTDLHVCLHEFITTVSNEDLNKAFEDAKYNVYSKSTREEFGIMIQSGGRPASEKV